MSQASKHAQLVELLYSRTQSDDIDWNFNENNTLYCIIAKNYILLRNWTSEDGTPFEEINIFSVEGNPIDSFNDGDISGRPRTPLQQASYFQLMSDLRKMAEKSAKGTDLALDEILQELNDIIPF